MMKTLGHAFLTIVRPVAALRELLESDPFRSYRLDPKAKRIVTFLRTKPTAKLELPIELYGAQILEMRGLEVFSAYVATPKGAVFMTLLEKTFGKEMTTRTWETVMKVAR